MPEKSFALKAVKQAPIVCKDFLDYPDGFMAMNVFKYALLALLLCLLGGFGFLAFYDVPVPQEDVVKDIPVEK